MAGDILICLPGRSEAEIRVR